MKKNFLIKCSFVLFMFFLLIGFASCGGSKSKAINNSNDSSVESNKNSSTKESVLPYSVTINLDGGKSSSFKDNLSYKVGSLDDIRLPFDVFKKSYAFIGYEYNNELVYNQDGQRIKDFEIKDNMVFKAIYTEAVSLSIYYTVYNPDTNEFTKYDSKPEFLGNVSESKSYAYNTSVSLHIDNKEGYTFNGWYNEGYLVSSNGSFTYNMSSEDFELECRYTLSTYSFSCKSSNENYGKILIQDCNSDYVSSSSMDTYYTNSITVRVNTTGNYTFIGWFDDNNNNVSNALVYTFNMPNKDYTLTARWDHFVIDYVLDGATNSENNPTSYKSSDGVITLEPATKGNSTFICWESNGKKIETIDPKSPKDYVLYPVFEDYYLTVKSNLDGAGTYTEYDNVLTIAGTKINLSATANEGYTFKGFFIGNVEVSLEYVMPNETVEIEARFEANKNTKYTVRHMWQNVAGTSYEEHDVETKYGTTGEYTNEFSKAYVGVTSSTITQKKITGDGKTVVDIYYTRNSYSLSVSSNDTIRGTVTGSNTYKFGASVTLKATTKAGYVFDGWYLNNERVSQDFNYQITMPSTDASYLAKWVAITFESNTNGIITMPTITQTTLKTGQTYTVVAPTSDYYDFSYWHINYIPQGNNNELEITLPQTDTVYTASYNAKKFTITIDNHTDFTFNGITSGEKYEYGKVLTLYSNKLKNNLFRFEIGSNVTYGYSYIFTVSSDVTIKIYTTGSYYLVNSTTMYYGTYPQSKVTDPSILTKLNAKISKTMPTASSLGSWKTYYYYQFGSSTDAYQFFQDIDLDGDGNKDFRAVYFSSYRSTNYAYNTETSGAYSNQDNNGYYINNVYWFKYDAIQWTYLRTVSPSQLWIANLILDSQQVTNAVAPVNNPGKNGTQSYAPGSYLSTFLNSTGTGYHYSFINAAFGYGIPGEGGDILQSQSMSYSASTGSGSSAGWMNSASLSAKVLLPTFSSLSNLSSKKSTGTDYALCQGLNVTNGYSYWLTGNQSSVYNYSLEGFDTSGNKTDISCYDTSAGIRPCIWVKFPS